MLVRAGEREEAEVPEREAHVLVVPNEVEPAAVEEIEAEPIEVAAALRP